MFGGMDESFSFNGVQQTDSRDAEIEMLKAEIEKLKAEIELMQSEVCYNILTVYQKQLNLMRIDHRCLNFFQAFWVLKRVFELICWRNCGVVMVIQVGKQITGLGPYPISFRATLWTPLI